MQNIKYGLLLVILSLFCFDATSQRRTRDRKKDRDKIYKTWLIDLQIDNEFYYKSFFQGIDGEEILLQSLIPDLDGRMTLTETSAFLEDYEYIRIINRKKTFRNSVISGLVVGVASFFIMKEISRNKDPGNLGPLNQKGSSGTVEGVLAGGLGFGVGILIYDSAFNKRMNITTHRDKIMQRLQRIKL